MALDVLRGAAQGLAGRALKRVAGNIRSGLFPNARGGSDFSDLAGLNTISGKFKTKNLTFPIDVEASTINTIILIRNVIFCITVWMG